MKLLDGWDLIESPDEWSVVNCVLSSVQWFLSRSLEVVRGGDSRVIVVRSTAFPSRSTPPWTRPATDTDKLGTFYRASLNIQSIYTSIFHQYYLYDIPGKQNIKYVLMFIYSYFIFKN